MKKYIILIAIFLIPFVANAITADKLLKEIDNKQFYQSIVYKSVMNITFEGEKLQKKMNVYLRDTISAYIEVSYPPEEKGTRYLKLEDEMWIYLPAADDVIRISGHMLKQSMLGSDMSYEDASSNDRLSEIYDAEFDTTNHDNNMYVLNLTANVKKTSYYRRKLYIDKSSKLILKMDLIAKSGKLLKTMKFDDYKIYGGIYIPGYMLIEDKIRGNSSTEMYLNDIKIGQQIPGRMFTKAYLRRKS
ncbi:hypothetical protein DRP43_01070 [candidate division TA06 bacterium]|mgnify:CR=1 FL=1|uniref:Uncharacterized protein TP-0789 domain-containing protein n=1 Tax=candidate division TA06 bacterium TaxID=2250710 RepID=A0A660SPD0_UNCT6|nr:MAG: hypothetical protein DRP43_01070 [candidate division TA06 bacterium]